MRSGYRVLALCVLAYFGTRVPQIVIGPVVPELRVAFGVSTGAVGAALSGMWIAYALAQVPSGVLSAWIGERRTVLGALGFAGAGSALLAVSPTYGFFAACTVALGAGVGLYYNAGTVLVVRELRGASRAIGIHRIGGQAAGIVAPAAAVLVAAQVGWRPALLLGGFVAIPVFGLFAAGIRPQTGRPAANPGRPTFRLHSPVARPAIVGVTFLATLGEFAGVASWSLLPAFLVDFRGFSVEQAGFLFSAYFVAVATVEPASGMAADRFGRRGLTALTFLAGAGGYALLILGPPNTLVPAIVLAAVAMGWNAPVQASAISTLATADRHTGFGVFRTAYLLLGALGAVVVGSTADLAGWAGAFGLLVAVLLVAGVGSILVVNEA